ncbi:hypothetical protein F7234_23080 [Pseudomonas putida]|uniref:hypothetical protein n=1 Tax=Pseudomonas putida TaxID=303 RepID=UPI00125F4F63|nr:hypothetical protein [Pseudomonas putida]KAB5618669.1 hypothetical protein F7234_23080 [Pseudomonas putida]
MTYLSSIKEVLTSFSTESNDRAVIFKGAWGTGKTHLWKQVVLAKRDSFHKRNYSYVSLFGLNSLRDLKQALFENKVARENAHIAPNESTLSENIKDLGSRSAGWFRKSSSWLKELSAFGVKGFGPAVEALQFLRVTDTLIVLDDFERKGSGLQDKEILGLISLLTENKNCRVLMLLHATDLSAEYFSYHEKVFNYEIQFNPTPEDAAEIAFATPTKNQAILKDNCVKLEIKNIRLLNKIKYYADLMAAPLEKANKAIVNQAYHTLPLAIIAIYGGNDAKVDIKYILEGDEFSSYLPGSEPSPEESAKIKLNQEKSEYLRSYGFTKTDEFDAAIIKFIECGYVEHEKLNSMIKSIEEKIVHEQQIYKLREAWNFYHSSFSTNESLIVAGFKGAISSALYGFSIHELDSVAELLTELGEAPYIKSVIDEYIAQHIPKQSLVEKEDVFQWPRTPYFSDKLNMFFNSLDETKPFKELLVDAYKSSSGVQKRNVLEQLAKASDSEYIAFLTSYEGYELNHIVRMLLKCGQVSTSDDIRQQMYEEVFVKTYRALLKLAAESRINQTRMSQFEKFSKLYAQAEEKLVTKTPLV